MKIVPTEPAMTEVMRKLYATSYTPLMVPNSIRGIENFLYREPSYISFLRRRTVPEVTLLGEILIQTAEGDVRDV